MIEDGKSNNNNAGDIKTTVENIESNHRDANLSRKRPRYPKNITVSLLHSNMYTETLHHAMRYIHKKRDVYLSSLLHHCGFVKETPKFFRVVPPKIATRVHLKAFHSNDYLNILDCSTEVSLPTDLNFPSSPTSGITKIHHHPTVLEKYGLVDDCHLPDTIEARNILWKYCLSISGASLHAAQLLCTNETQVAINWGGGRHHAHANYASGFCFVNDVVLAIQYSLLHNKNDRQLDDYTSCGPCQNEETHSASCNIQSNKEKNRIMYIDIDIHHADGVQSAFYDTNQVLTISLHRFSPGFFPCSSGSPGERGQFGTKGVGYNLNIPMPKSTCDSDFVEMVNLILEKLLPEYDPHIVVLCVGADGLKGDDLVYSNIEGWNLTPEGIAECVRLTAIKCAGTQNSNDNETNPRVRIHHPTRKLLILGGGGYNDVNTARTFLLCTAAACEGARPGLLYKELPKDVPLHEHFIMYGPSFRLIHEQNILGTQSNVKTRNSQNDKGELNLEKNTQFKDTEYIKLIESGKMAIDTTVLFLQGQKLVTTSSNSFCYDDSDEVYHDDPISHYKNSKRVGGGRRRRKKNERIL